MINEFVNLLNNKLYQKWSNTHRDVIDQDEFRNN